jgi:hypothetical protein
VVDVLGELVAQLGSNLVVALADKAIRGGEALQVGDRLNVPNLASLRASTRSQAWSKIMEAIALLRSCSGQRTEGEEHSLSILALSMNFSLSDHLTKCIYTCSQR